MSSRALQHLSQALNSGFNAIPPYGIGSVTPTAMDIDAYIARVQFERFSQDVLGWRESIAEAELPYYPMRVRMQRIFMDTVENPYIKAVLERWKELTLQRDYIVYRIEDGVKVEDKTLTAKLEQELWFKDIIEYVLEAMAYGYSFISLGNIVNDSFPNVRSIRRENIRPDGIGNSGPILTSLIYAVDGLRVTQDPLIDMCNLWIPTKSNRGVSKCGYGFLYNVGLLEIHLRHVMEWNVDYVEMFGQPIKKGFTNKTDKKRKQFRDMLASSASNAWALLDRGTNDDITYEFPANAGTAWKSYENLEARLQAQTCQIILGHSDAMTTSPDKLGGNQKSNKDGDNINLIQVALNAKQVAAGDFVCRKMNEEVIPKLRRLGEYIGSEKIKNLIPDDCYFGLKNDIEEAEIKRKDNQDKTQVSLWVSNLNKAGFNVDVTELSARLGIKLTEAPPEQKLLQYRKTETEITRNEEEENKTTQ